MGIFGKYPKRKGSALSEIILSGEISSLPSLQRQLPAQHSSREYQSSLVKHWHNVQQPHRFSQPSGQLPWCFSVQNQRQLLMNTLQNWMNKFSSKGKWRKTYSFNSLNKASTLFSEASRTMISSFSTLTYSGSLYLQKKTRISFDRMSDRFCRRRLIFLRATHWTSGGEDKSVTNGGAILRTSCLINSSRRTFRIWIMITWWLMLWRG